MGELHVRLFGKVLVEWEGHQVTKLSAKASELLCYLLVYRDRAHTREALADVLWPQAPQSLSKKYLRQTLWQLQAAIGSPHGPGNGDGDGRANGKDHGNGAATLLALNPGWVRVNPDPVGWLDLQAFEDAWALCRDRPDRGLTDRQAEEIEQAVGLYRGDLMEAWYQDWCIYERDRLQLSYLAMLQRLMDHCRWRGWFVRGVAYGQLILRRDPAREYTHRELMRLYYHAGDRTSALRQYERCKLAVAREFSLAPSAETVSLYERLRQDREDTTPRTFPGGRPEQDPAGDLRRELRELGDQLSHLRAGMSALQRELDQLTGMTRAIRATLETVRQTRPETG
jgi:DNA-binding SARP family transcriptional activator